MSDNIKPLVSVIIPSYNLSRFIEETINSVLNQTYNNIEIILIDDGSTDKTHELFSKFEDKGVRCITQLNKGASSARNHGLSLAKGDYIQFLDADDILHSSKIEKQLAQMEFEKANLSFTLWGEFNVSIDKVKKVNPEGVNYDLLTDGVSLLKSFGTDKWFLPIHSWLININLIRKAGNWNENISNNDDGEYMCRVLCFAEKVSVVHEHLSFYRKAENSITLSSVNNFKKAASLLNSWQMISSHCKAFQDNELMAYPKKGFYISYISTKYTMPEIAKQFAKEFDRIDAPFFLDTWKYYWFVKWFGLYKGGKLFFVLIKLRLIRTNYYPI